MSNLALSDVRPLNQKASFIIWFIIIVYFVPRNVTQIFREEKCLPPEELIASISPLSTNNTKTYSSLRATRETTPQKNTPLLRYWKELEIHNDTDPPPKSVVNYIPRQHAISSGAIVMATHISADANRFENARTSIERWGGPVSLAVYIQSKDDIYALDTFAQEADFIGNTSIHVLMEKTSDPGYPHNVLRNLALDNIGSDYFFALDVDHIPPKNSYASIQSLLDSKRSKIRQELQNKTLFVLPAFEVCSKELIIQKEILKKKKKKTKKNGKTDVARNKNVTTTMVKEIIGSANAESLPSSKSDLIAMTKAGDAWIFHIETFKAGQGPTDYERWYAQEGNNTDYYYIQYKKRYEPYVVGYRPGIHPYWTAFRGFGYNKDSWFLESSRAGYSFAVLRDFYVVHLCHPKKTNKPSTVNYDRFKEFQRYLIQKYPFYKRATRTKKESRQKQHID